MTETDDTRAPNRLIHEKSPYLLQHARNPVDWYPWGEEAFARAAREDKPIFLSIGYSTCHWCHVMERESFENDEVAALLNEHFVPVKVDREERPDVDRIYMTAMQAMGMGGGWPLNVFLTPDRKPFFGGTYFPPDDRHGRAGMTRLLPGVHAAWRARRDELAETGARVFAALAAISPPDVGDVDRAALLDECHRTLARAHDAERGGFGRAPKFPSVANLNFLFRWWAADPARRADALEMALGQLDHMIAGGIHDQIGGGFHRYSTDREWLVPHFEKMLYDQAQIAWALLDAWRITGERRYADAAAGLFEYVDRDLTSPDGAFLSAEDADSEGEEGRFYVWTPAEIEDALAGAPAGAPAGPPAEPDEASNEASKTAALFAARYGVTHGGNFEHETSILHHAMPLEDAARAAGVDPAEAPARLARARAALLEVRKRRVRPHLDDKVIAAWNGLMISACARGARALGDATLAARAERAATFVWKRLRDERTGELSRRWRDGETAGAGQLDDYAFLALGFHDLYAATFDPVWLARAATLVERMIARFADEHDGALFESPDGDPHVALRMKDDFDGAELAGASVAAWVLVSLAALLDRDDWRARADRLLDHYARRLQGQAMAMPQMLVAMDLAAATPRHVVIAGDPAAAATRALLAEFDRRFLPHDALLVVDGGARRRALAPLVPFAAALPAPDGEATAYVCIGYACRLPVTDPAALAALLDETQGAVAPIVQEEKR